MSWQYLTTIGYGLLVGTALLHSGFIRGPGEYFQSIVLLGLVVGFVLGFRRAKKNRFGRAAVYVASYIASIFLPSLVWWGWLVWEVQSVPVPPNTAIIIARHTEPTRFTGNTAWLIEGKVELPHDVIDEFASFPKEGRETAAELRLRHARLQDARAEVIAGIESFYRERLVADGWRAGSISEVAGRSSEFPVRERRVEFTRTGETIELVVYPNTFDVTFLISRADPMPFGPIRLPDLPWSRRPVVPRPVVPVVAPAGGERQ